MLKKIILISIILGIVLMPYSPNLTKNNHVTHAAAIASLSIPHDTTWTLANSPYIIGSDYGGGESLWILSGAALTIEPGVVVKMNEDASIRVEGELIANGEAGNPVIFTSILDDIIEDNSPGFANPPEAGDWQAIYAYDNGQINLKHTTVRYGGFMRVYLERNDNNLIIPNNAYAQREEGGANIGAVSVKGEAGLTINNSLIASNTIGIEISEVWNAEELSIAAIHNSEVVNNTEAGIKNNTEQEVDAANNWWGHATGPYHEILNPDGRGNAVIGAVLFIPWLSEAPGEEPNQPPVIESFGQYKSDGETELYAQEITAGDSVVFKAMVSDQDGDKVKTETELKMYNLIPGSEFDGQNTGMSELVNSGEEATTSWDSLVNSNYHWRLRAIDEHGLVSNWQYVYPDSEIDPDFNFIVKKAPLYTQNYSPYPSWGKTEDWFDEDYINGGTTYSCAPGIRATIARCGCAITSVIMMLRYHGITEDVDESDINPLNINNWLKTAHDYDGDQITGYYSNGNLSWDAIPEYSRAPAGSIQPGLQRIVKRGIVNGNPGTLANTLDEDLENYQPVILKTRIAYQNGRYGDHFVLTPEKFTSTYRVNDPYWYNTKNLNHTVTGIGYEKNYYNYYTGLRRFAYLGNTYDTRPVHYAGITQTIASPAELIIIAPNGQKLGFDPMNNTEYNEIVGGTYTSEDIGDPEGVDPAEAHKTKTIWIPDPEPGEYQLRVIGTGKGVYTLYSHITDNSGRPQADDFTSNILAGKVFEYALDYDKENIDNSDIVIVDKTSPEASIYFDADLEKLTVIGIDDITATPIVTIEEKCAKKIWKRCVKKEYIYTISDEAGNTLKLWIEKYQHGRKVLARIKKIQYNNDEKIKTRAVLTFIWKKKNNSLKFLSQTVGSHREFIVNGIYKQHKDNTRIRGYDWEENKRIKETRDGLIIIELNTDEGRVDYEY